jgi:hypothetical protein
MESITETDRRMIKAALIELDCSEACPYFKKANNCRVRCKHVAALFWKD